MDVTYINPFIEACQFIITKVTGFEVTLGKIFVKQSPYAGENVAVIIGVTGRVRGTAVFSLKPQAACKIAGAMIGTPVLALDEMGKSAISELSNMILGKAATIFSDRDIRIDISPPTLLMGENMQFSADNVQIISIPLEFGIGDKVILDVSFETT